MEGGGRSQEKERERGREELVVLRGSEGEWEVGRKWESGSEGSREGES
jgi:hypothetical protein